MPSDFVELVRRGVRVAGSQRALGKAIGVSEQNISRAVNRRGYPFNVLNCMRLARLIEEQDWVVLRAAGKPEIAKLLEQRYGDRPMKRSASIQDSLHGLSPAQRRHVLALVRDLVGS